MILQEQEAMKPLTANCWDYKFKTATLGIEVESPEFSEVQCS